MNLLAKLKNGRHFKKSRRSTGIVLISLLVGAFLFRFYGIAAYSYVENYISDSHFVIAYTVVFALLMLSAFSQIGTLLVILVDAAFEFFLVLYSCAHTSVFSVKSVSLLALQVFAIILFTMFFSERAFALSAELAGRTVSDKKYFASVTANLILFFAFLAAFVIICFTAF